MSAGPVCRMRLAVNGMRRGRETGYIDVSSFGASGEAAARTLARGWQVAIEGRLEQLERAGRLVALCGRRRWARRLSRGATGRWLGELTTRRAPAQVEPRREAAGRAWFDSYRTKLSD